MKKLKIKKGDLMPWFLEDHGQLPQWYLDDTEKFFKWFEKKTSKLQAPSSKLQAPSATKRPQLNSTNKLERL